MVDFRSIFDSRSCEKNEAETSRAGKIYRHKFLPNPELKQLYLVPVCAKLRIVGPLLKLAYRNFADSDVKLNIEWHDWACRIPEKTL